MIRFGVHRREQYSPNQGWLQGLMHGRRVSYRLLRTSTPATPAEIAIFDDIIFYLKLASGVYTTTVPGRFREFDAWLTEHLSPLFDRDRPMVVEDWGTSDSTTSAEWFPVLRQQFPETRLIASDLTRHLVEATVENDGVYVLDADGQPLQYIAPPFVIRFPEPIPFVINRWIASGAKRRLARLAAGAKIDLSDLQFDRDGQDIHRPPFVFRRLPLVHPRAAALSRTEPAFEVAQHSAFDLSSREPDVIRTMNVLNRDYFSDARLGDAVRSVWASLKDGGVWIVGRTITESPRVHHASLVRKTGTGFELLARHVAPSEVEALALAFVAPA
jgi:hypothetical protein